MLAPIQIKYDTSTKWTSVNPVLRAGEEGYETDTKKRKVGDGVSKWNDLEYDTVDLTEVNVKIDNLEQKVCKPAYGLFVTGTVYDYIIPETDEFSVTAKLALNSEGAALILTTKPRIPGNNYYNNNSAYFFRYLNYLEFSAFLWDGTQYNRVTKTISNNYKGEIFDGAMSIKDGEQSFWYNGVKVLTGTLRYVSTDKFSHIWIGAREPSNMGDTTIYQLNRFNYSFTQADVDRFYNQGRVFDVQFGDEFRNTIANYNKQICKSIVKEQKVTNATYIDNTLRFTPTSKYGYTTLGGTYTDNDVKVGMLVELEYDSNVALTHYGIFSNNENFLTTKYIGKVGHNKFIIPVDMAGSNIREEIMFRYDSDDLMEVVVDNITIRYIGLLDEFTPDSLTPKRWVNTGTISTNIEFTNPVFSYQNPITEHQWVSQGSTYPVPVAMGQKLYILNNDGTRTIKESPCKPNNRQWDNLKDWQ